MACGSLGKEENLKFEQVKQLTYLTKLAKTPAQKLYILSLQEKRRFATFKKTDCDCSQTGAMLGSQLSFATLHITVAPIAAKGTGTVPTVANEVLSHGFEGTCDGC